MPSKYRTKKKAYRDHYIANVAAKKQTSQKYYQNNKSVIKCQISMRKITDKTGKQKNVTRSLTRQKQRLQDDEQYRQENRARARVSTRKRLAENEHYRKLNTTRAIAGKKKLQESESCRQQASVRANTHKKIQLSQSEEYRKLHQNRVVACRRKKLNEDKSYRQLHQMRLKKQMQSRRQNDKEYRERIKARARLRMKVKRNKEDCPATDGGIIPQQMSRFNNQLSAQWRYWTRRTRLLAAARKQQRLLTQEKKMQTTSPVSMLDIRLLFRKAEYCIRKASSKLQSLHIGLCNKIKTCLDKLPTDRTPDETEITAAFGDVRIHTSTSEPYFSEQVYRRVAPEFPIPIDTLGRAQLFTAYENPKNQQQPTQSNDGHSKVSKWLCNTDLCHISNDMITGTVALLRKITSPDSLDCLRLYIDINQCQNPNRTDNLGHPLNCQLDCNCSSLLRPAKLLSSHFGLLRNVVRSIYELRRIALAIRAVNKSKDGGCFMMLKAAVKHLLEVCSPSPSDDEAAPAEDVPAVVNDCSVDEEQVMQEFGKALRKVTDERDTYTTKACDVCEQLKTKLSSLRSYENKKGFDSQKMTEVIELLYINKTKHEDITEFLDNTYICDFCVDKLRGNKDVARSAFNHLAVIPTPPCIANLNVFERSLIKQCLTSISVIRLGQVSNKHRPPNELNSALKGRIAYLPVDVTANASFLPDSLFNTDSLVLLVGGQPTTKQKIWSSAVNLNKVHAALLWLKENNQLYKEVPAYTVDDINKIITQRLEGRAETVTKCNNSSLLKKLDDATKSFLYENFTIQPLNTEYPADAMIDYQLDKVSGQSANIFDTNLDLLTYPELFPTGVNGIKDTMREVKIGTSDYIKSRLLNKDSKFRLNINYLFHCFQTQEVSNMCHSIGHMLHSVTGRNLTAKEFYDRLQAKDGEIQKKMFTLLANLRGSKEYFSKLGLEIRWMIKQLGPPTLFLTCSCAEWFSAPLIEHLRTINKDTAPNVDKMTPAELCALDPVTVSIHFHKKWHSIFTSLINVKDNGIFGTVEDFFWRIEYQARGAPHVHCVLWIKDAPILGKNTPEEVKHFINKVCTCAKPDAAKSPTLSQLVTQFQMHKCNSYCQKSYKRNGRFCKKCRFGFPRPPKEETEIYDLIDCLAVAKNKQPRKRLYQLRRSTDEVKINDYNPALLLANQANVDIQFIGHLGSRLPYYITSYITKSERSEVDKFWSNIFSATKSLGSNAMSFMLKCVKSRQVGANEAADRLLGHKLYSKSRQTRFADLEPAHKAKRVLKPAADISQLLKSNPESEDIFLPHWVLDVYPARPDEMEDTSLHELLRWYERQKIVTGKEPLQLKSFGYYLRRRTVKPYIVTHKVTNPQKSEEDKETYFYHLLKLFKPWRSESDLRPADKTFSQTFAIESSKLPEMAAYHDHNVQAEQQEQQMENEVRERAEELCEKDVSEVQDGGEAFEGCVDDRARNAMQDILDTHRAAVEQDAVNANDLNEKYNSLNIDQKRVVDKVVEKLKNDDVIRLIVSGQGGTGKSRVIEVLNRLVTRDSGANSLPVVVAAPTGLAAVNVGGSTIHRVLSLPVEHGKPADYNRLNQEQLTIVRSTLRGLRLLICDEVSMVSSLTLLYMHLRLSEIFNSSELFGGLSVVFFADLLQLPAVKGNSVFMSLSSFEAKQRIGCVAPLSLWQSFEYDELTINMRQSSDLRYAELLSSVRIGQISTADVDLLKGRFIADGRRATVDEICNRYKQLTDDGHTPIVLMPRTDQCREVNSALLAQIGTPIHNIPAIDILDTIVSKQTASKVTAAYRKTVQDPTRTAGLESCLQLCIGAKVMLRRNMKVECGLVNGSIGSVVGFGTSSTQFTHISVQFDNLPEPVCISRESCTFEVLKSIFYTRKQFPIMLAFSITVHKAQGLSLNTAIVDAGPASFGCGMTYVSLSRVTKINGLHLIDFDRTKILCDHHAISEYNRLRSLYTPHLGQLDGEPTTKTGCKVKNSGKRVKKAPNKTSKRLKADEQQQSQSSGKRVKKAPKKASKRLKADEQQQSLQLQVSQPQHSVHQADIIETDAEEHSIYQYCQVTSVDNDFKQTTCDRLNLKFCGSENTRQGVHHNTAVSESLRQAIRTKTGQDTKVSLYKVVGDGNCLFRALSLAITGSQRQHALLRSYIVNHMMDESIHGSIREGSNAHFHNYLGNMEKAGVWGTDKEIAAAAHLFKCSIICYSRYSPTGNFCLQQFSPHFTTMAICNNTCHHPSIYLINSSGSHYETATITLPTLHNEP